MWAFLVFICIPVFYILHNYCIYFIVWLRINLWRAKFVQGCGQGSLNLPDLAKCSLLANGYLAKPWFLFINFPLCTETHFKGLIHVWVLMPLTSMYPISRQPAVLRIPTVEQWISPRQVPCHITPSHIPSPDCSWKSIVPKPFSPTKPDKTDSKLFLYHSIHILDNWGYDMVSNPRLSGRASKGFGLPSKFRSLIHSCNI